jgi:MinD-like ATPase involved in chromosome partitioning or flagellar assembly
MHSRAGTIVTFYSYKGGTGRSMTMANLAWILAANGMKVLAIDWDLEAPGLHRYFRPFLIDPELHDTEGLTDFFWRYAEGAMTPRSESEGVVAWENATDLSRFRVQIDWEFKGEGQLDLVPAGRQCAEYAERVNSFDWTNFYRRLHGEQLLKHLRSRLKQEYDWVLVDSRTGVSDSAGICTVAMPDRLVAFFTLNRQSVDGVQAVLDSIVPQRPDITIFPVVTRVELAEKERLEAARRRVRKTFSRYAEKAERGDALKYWSDAEILYQPYYAYEEVLACFADRTGADYSESSLLASVERIGRRITGDTSLAMPEVLGEERKLVLERALGSGDPAQSEVSRDIQSFDELSESRRARSNRYLQQDLGDPIGAYRRKGRDLQGISTLAGFFIVGLALAMLVFLFRESRATWPSMLLLVACGIGKALELGLERSKELKKLAAQLLGVFVAATGAAVPAVAAFTGERDVAHATLLALTISAIQLAFMMSGADTERLALPIAATTLERELRDYVGIAKDYEETVGEQVAWRRFRHRVEEVLSETPPPKFPVQPSAKPPR